MKKTTQLTSVDAPIYNYWSALWKSFYSRRLYVDVGKRWSGFGILYLLLVIALLSLPFYLRVLQSVNQSFQEQIIEPSVKIPAFIVQNGEVNFDKPMPYFIKNDAGKIIAAIDTTGKVTAFTNAYPDLSILVSKHKIAFKVPVPQIFTNSAAQQQGKIIEQEFDSKTNFVFDGKQLLDQSFVSTLKYLFIFITYPIIVAILFSVFIVFFPFFAVLGQTFSLAFFSFKLNFATSCRLLVVAGTPMLLVLVTMLTLNRMFTGLGVLLFILLILYYSFALYALRAESRNLVRT